MRFLSSRLRHVEALVEAYRHPEPFDLHIKRYFRQHRNMGSKDRRAVRALTYAFLRWGNAWSDRPLKEGILIAAAGLDPVAPESWNELAASLPLQPLPENWAEQGWAQRKAWLAETFAALPEPHYPQAMLQVEFAHLNTQALIGFRPAVWVRDLGADPAALVDLEPHPTLQGAYAAGDHAVNEGEGLQIQDLASQRLLSHVVAAEGERIWDCCCGSGGKSIALARAKVQLYLTDLRISMLEAAQRRIKAFGGRIAERAELDLAAQECPANWPLFDRIIADVPCTGSGTWFRHPEHFRYFDPASLKDYQALQRTIVSKAWSQLKPGGSLYYMTCSVFGAENADQVEHFRNTLGANVVVERAVDGSSQRSDSMFIAVLVKRDKSAGSDQDET